MVDTALAAAGDATIGRKVDPTTLTARGRRTYDLLLRSARTIFERDGFLAARIVDICEHAGVAHGSFYTYFDSKPEIYIQLAYTGVHLDFFPSVPTRDRIRSSRDAVDAIHSTIQDYIDEYRRNADFMQTLEEAALCVPEVAEYRAAKIREGVAHVASTITLMQELDLADAEIDPDHTAVALMAMVMRYTSMWLAKSVDLKRELDPEASVRALTLSWVRTLGVTSSAQRGLNERPDE